MDILKIGRKINKLFIMIFLLPFFLGSSLFGYGIGQGLIGEYFLYGEEKRAFYVDTKGTRAIGSGNQHLYTIRVVLKEPTSPYKDTLLCPYQVGRDTEFYKNLHLFANNVKPNDEVLIKTLTSYRGRLLKWKDLEIKTSKWPRPIGHLIVFFLLIAIALFTLTQIVSILLGRPSYMNKIEALK